MSTMAKTKVKRRMDGVPPAGGRFGHFLIDEKDERRLVRFMEREARAAGARDVMPRRRAVEALFRRGLDAVEAEAKAAP
jgi:hypothetical protein